jgi:DNA-binding transcriptional ArsR family regulator
VPALFSGNTMSQATAPRRAAQASGRWVLYPGLLPRAFCFFAFALTFVLVITKVLRVLLESSTLIAIASPRRREILRLVWDGELAAGAIHHAMPDVTFGAVSQQLRALVDAGLVECRAEKTQRLYRARREALGPVARMLEAMWNDALWRLKLAAELEETRRGPRPTRNTKVTKLRSS